MTQKRIMLKMPTVETEIPEINTKNGNLLARYRASVGYVTSVNDGIGIVEINDALVSEPQLGFFGGIDYKALSAILEDFEEDDAVEKVVIDINSPGGAINGLYETLSVMKALNKPVYCFSSGYVCSASYAIASATKGIYATPQARIGSIGAYMEFVDSKDFYENAGIRHISFYGQNSDMKNLDPQTDKGKEMYQDEINKVEDMFLSAIAENRGIEKQEVIENFGHGQVFFADEAKNRKMIDGIVANFDEFITMIKGDKYMADDKKEVKTGADLEYRIEQARNEAVKAERERVKQIGSFGTVKDAGLKALVDKALEDGTSLEAFKLVFADKALEVLNRQGEKARNVLETEKAESENIPSITGKTPVIEKPSAKQKAKMILDGLNQREKEAK